jgi:hypothetical protein
MTMQTTPSSAMAAAPRMQAAGVLALELAPGTAIVRDALPQADAGELARLVGRDLGALAEAVRDLDLVFAAAHFDPAEALRPGWPLHRRLDELRQRAPQHGHAPRILAFGADAHGNVPQPLASDEALRGGQLRVLPFVLSEPRVSGRAAGEATTADAVGNRLERILLDAGMVQAETALCAQEAFGARIEHARYLTVHDLAAMTALQYGNQGLEALWGVIETALLRPGQPALLDAPPEPLLRYVEGEARIALFSPDAWRRRHADLCGEGDAGRIARTHALFEARQRQYAAVLRAHGIDVVFAHCEDAAQL